MCKQKRVLLSITHTQKKKKDAAPPKSSLAQDSVRKTNVKHTKQIPNLTRSK